MATARRSSKRKAVKTTGVLRGRPGRTGKIGPSGPTGPPGPASPDHATDIALLSAQVAELVKELRTQLTRIGQIQAQLDHLAKAQTPWPNAPVEPPEPTDH